MVDNTIYIDTTTVDSSTSTHSSTGSSTSMRPEIEINTDHPDAIPAPIEINTDHPAAMFVHGIRSKIQNTNTIEAPNDVVRPNESNLGDKLATVDEGLATAFHTVHQFFKGGLYQVYKDQGAELPEWTHKVAGVLNNPDYNQAMSQGAFITYGKGLNTDNMLKGMAMKDAGSTPEQIFRATRAEEYAGRWGERVPYSGMELKVKPEANLYNLPKETTLGNVIKHDPLFAADVSLKKIRVRAMTPVEQDRYSPETFGFAEVSNNTIVIRPNLSEADFKKSLVHETEHIVQEKHGLPQGSSPEAFQDSKYRNMVADKDIAYITLAAKVKNLQTNGQAKNLPKFTQETVDQLVDLVGKGKYTPGVLNPAQTMAYKDILKYGLDKELMAVRATGDAVIAQDILNMRKYRLTKGEVGARVGEKELKHVPEVTKNTSYRDAMEAEVPEKQRINSPLDGNPASVVPPKDFPKELKGSNENTSPRIANKSLWDRLASQQKGKDVWSGIKDSLNNLRTSLSEKVFGKSEIRPNRPANENVKFDAQTMGNSDRAYLEGIDQLLKMSNKEFFEKMHDPKTLEMLKKNPVGEKKLNTFIAEIEKLQKPTLSKYEEALQRQKDKPKPK